MRPSPSFLPPALVVFALSWGVGAALSGCSGAHDCECPPLPQHPDEQVLPLLGGIDFGEDGNQSIRPIDFSEGTMRIEKSRIVIDYREGEATYQVVYAQE